MRALGLQGARRGKKIRTTTPDPGHESAADRLQRDFTALRPNAAWVADFTHVTAWCGAVYVAFVVDVYSRAIVGWAASLTTDRPVPPAVSCGAMIPGAGSTTPFSAWHKPVITRDSRPAPSAPPPLAQRRTTPQWQSGRRYMPAR